VKSVGITTRLPLGDGDGAGNFHRSICLVGNQPGSRYPVCNSRLPSHTSGTPLEGRYFRADENASKPHVAIVNLTMARQYFRDTDPIGKRIVREGDSPQPIEIVGDCE